MIRIQKLNPEVKMVETLYSTQVDSDGHDNDRLNPSTVISSDNSTNYSEDVIGLKKSFIRNFLTFLTVEPMMFLHMVGWSTSAINVQNFYIETVCRREYSNDPAIDCSNLSTNKTAETHVEGITAYYMTYRSLIEAGLPVIFSLFVGPWSDKHGSKMTMILPLIGYILSSLLFYVFVMMKVINPAILLIASIPVALSGGVIAFILSGFRYVAAITTTENRSFRIAIAEGTWFLGVPIGLLGSAALLKSGGLELVFATCIILFSTATGYAIFFIKSDKPIQDTYNGNSNLIQDMFNFAAVKETMLTPFRQRPGSQRLWILLLLGTIYIRIFTLYGSSTITYLYTRKMFQWDTTIYTQYATYDGVVGIIGSGILAIFGMKFFKIPDPVIGLISSISYLGGAIVWTLSSLTALSWMMPLGATIQMFCGLVSIVTRSMLSKIVSKDELGKLFSFLASGEAAIPLFASPIYSILYAKSLDTFPGSPYILNAVLNFNIFLCFLYFCFSSWKETEIPHEELEEDIIEDTPSEVQA